MDNKPMQYSWGDRTKKKPFARQRVKKSNSWWDLSSMEELKHSNEFNYSVQMTRWLLEPLGLWPIKSKSYVSLALRSLSIAISMFLMAFLLVPFSLQWILIERDFGVRLRMIGPISFFLMNVFKYFAMLQKQKLVGSCVWNVALGWHRAEKEEQRSVLMKDARSIRFYTTICLIALCGGTLPYVTIMPLVQGVTMVGNASYHQLAYPSYFVFFNPHVMPVYSVIFLIQCFGGLFMALVTCGVYSFAILCILHICSQCNITSMDLLGLTKRLDSKNLEKIVKQHLGSLRFASNLEDLLSNMYLVEMMGSTFNICMIGYYMITEIGRGNMVGASTYSLLMSSFVFNIFIICYIGELLTERCHSIGKFAYEINWYQFSGKDARNIIMIVASTQRPVVLTAGKMITMSILSFANVIKASVTYLNMLRTVTANS